MSGEVVADLAKVVAFLQELAEYVDRSDKPMVLRAVALLQERDALRKDAGRYRWLRDKCGARKPGTHMNPAFCKIEFYSHAAGLIGDGPTIDAAIDAALPDPGRAGEA